MDIANGLAKIAQAIGIVKDLREVGQDVEIETVKSQMAGLYGKLADVKIAFADARQVIHEKDQIIRELEARIVALSSGETCAICEIGTLKVTASRQHPSFGFAGSERTVTCNQCGHSEKRLFDPDNVAGRRQLVKP